MTKKQIKQSKVKTKRILIKEVCPNLSCPFWDEIVIHKHDEFVPNSFYTKTGEEVMVHAD